MSRSGGPIEEAKPAEEATRLPAWNRPLRVLHVISNLGVGGAQEAIRTLVEAQAITGCWPVVCTFQDGPLREPIEGQGIPVEILRGRAHDVLALPLFLADVIRIRRDLLKIIEKHNIDVVQTNLLRAFDFLVLSLRIRRRLRVFWTIQNSEFTLRHEHLRRAKWMLRPKRWAHALLYRLTSRWVNGIIAVSDEVKTAILRDIGPVGDKISVICNAVDVARYQRRLDRLALRRQLGIPESAFVLIVVATFKKQKGHCYLLDAAASVSRRFPQLHIMLAGDGELKSQLLAQTEKLGLQRHVHFLGTRHDIPDLLAASDCFVLPSLWEGLSLALLEAMASGLPIIATAVAGSTQVMVDGVTGYLIPPGSVRELEEAIIHLLSDPVRARGFGTAAQRRVEALFGARNSAAQHMALYLGQSNRDQHASNSDDSPAVGAAVSRC